MKKQNKIFLLLCVFIITVFSCSKDTIQSATTTTETAATVTFNNYIKPNVLGKCTGCHGGKGGITYAGTYTDLFGKKSSFNSSIQNGSMPQDGPLATADKVLIKAWIDRGAPEN